MTASTLLNRVRMTVYSAPGTGIVLLGSAVTGFQTFAAAGATNGMLVSYVLEDGANWEIGQGTYSTTLTALGRTTITASSNGGAAINAGASTIVSASALAADFAGTSGNFEVGALLGVGMAPTASTTSVAYMEGDISLVGVTATALMFNGYYASGWKAFADGYAGAIRFDSSTGTMALMNSPASVTAGSASNIAYSVYIDKAGQVGIGHAPTEKLDVYANVDGEISAKVYNNNTGANAQSRFTLSTGTSGSYVISIVGDNSAAPFYQLSAGPAILHRYDYFPDYYFRDQAGSASYLILNSTGATFNADVTLSSNSGGTILTVGNMASGATATPTCLEFDHSFSNTAGSYPKIDLFGGTYGIGLSSGTMEYLSGGSHNWWTTTTNTMTLSNLGNLTVTGTLTVSSVSGASSFNTSSAGNTLGTSALIRGDATHTGYVSFLKADGTRLGYVGYSTATGYLQLESENGCLGYNVTGALTVVGSATTGGVQQASGFRNMLDNGAFNIAQRATTAALIQYATNAILTVDRWSTYYSANSTVATVTQVSGMVAGFRNYLCIQRTAASSIVTNLVMGQALETARSIQLQGKTVTLSFWAQAGADFSGASSQLIVRMFTGTGTDQAYNTMTAGSWTGNAQPLNSTATISTTWTRFTFTVTLGASISQVGIIIHYATVGTAGAADLFNIAGVQLELGSVATPYEFLPPEVELQRCQRYYETSGIVGAFTASTGVSQGGSHPTANYKQQVPFKVAKRATPTVTTYDRAGTAAKCSYYVAAWTDAGVLSVTPAATVSGFYCGHAIANSIETQFSWTASADL